MLSPFKMSEMRRKHFNSSYPLALEGMGVMFKTPEAQPDVAGFVKPFPDLVSMYIEFFLHSF